LGVGGRPPTPQPPIPNPQSPITAIINYKKKIFFNTNNKILLIKKN